MFAYGTKINIAPTTTTINNNLVASSSTTLNSTLNVSSSTTLNSTLNVSGITTLNSTLSTPQIATSTYNNLLAKSIEIYPFSSVGGSYNNGYWLIDVQDYCNQAGFVYLFLQLSYIGRVELLLLILQVLIFIMIWHIMLI